MMETQFSSASVMSTDEVSMRSAKRYWLPQNCYFHWLNPDTENRNGAFVYECADEWYKCRVRDQ
jgi:hypothetical protein